MSECRYVAPGHVKVTGTELRRGQELRHGKINPRIFLKVTETFGARSSSK
jgi:hypothetical protein